MYCDRFQTPGGGYAIVCRGGRRPQPKPCKACGAPSTRLCDFPLKGKKAGKTCSAPICDRCRTAFGDEIDYCPPHAKLAAAAACDAGDVLSCETCQGKAPRCSSCLDNLEEQLAGVAAIRGELWGGEVRAELGRRGRALEPWPSWDTGSKVGDIARRKMADVAGADERLLERLAKRCAAAAARAYGGT
jgi:hypothetical protein